MAVKFQTVERPTVTRTRKANPYTETVKELAADMTKTVAVTDLPYTSEDEQKAVQGLIGQVQAAGRDLNVSVRKMLETAETGNGKAKVVKATVTFWAVEPIKRPRSLD
jgi:hypothetical protein